jgi:hypothetical protein
LVAAPDGRAAISRRVGGKHLSQFPGRQREITDGIFFYLTLTKSASEPDKSVGKRRAIAHGAGGTAMTTPRHHSRRCSFLVTVCVPGLV